MAEGEDEKNQGREKKTDRDKMERVIIRIYSNYVNAFHVLKVLLILLGVY